MLKTAYNRLSSGQKSSGLVIVKKDLPLARAIEDLELLLQCCTEADLENQVVFIPL